MPLLRVRRQVLRSPVHRPITLDAAILALSPQGYWKLNETSGTTAFDSSGNGRNGTYTGSGFTLAGAVGGDGANYVDLGNAASSHIAVADNNVWSANNAAGMTIFALIKPDSVAGTTRQFIIAKDGGASNAEWGWAINEGAGGRVNHRVWTPAGTAIMLKKADGVITAAWQAVVMAHGTVAQSAAIGLYRNNNTDIAASEGAGTTNTYANGAAEVRIGWRADSPASQYWAGGMAHVAIFAGQLDTTQIQSLMTAARNAGWFP